MTTSQINWYGKVALVTGGASGIGRALAERAAREGASVAVADLDVLGALRVTDMLPGGPHWALGIDVADPESLSRAIDRVETVLGPIDAVFSNAGINRGRDLGEDDDWRLSLDIHLLAHVNLARLLVPRMLSRGGGIFSITASAAGLLTNLESAPYSASKHAAVALAEWLAIRYGDDGLAVSCSCPQGVRTGMTAGREDADTGSTGFIGADEAADAVFSAIAEGRFLVLPHPEVAVYEQRRAADRERWISGMRRVRARSGTASSIKTEV